MILRANCKINLGLDVLRRREDGFHELDTVMLPVRGLYDLLTIEPLPNSSEIEFRGEGISIDCPASDNLCVKAAELMQRRYGVEQGVSITLDKQIPFGAGLGGGSADATSVILAFDSIFELGLSEEELIGVAAEIGSDTAFFVRNTPQICRGRGEIMEPIDLPLDGLTLVLIKPDGVNVSTREAYGGVRPFVPTQRLSELLKLPIERWQGAVKNDFEPHIFEAYPLLAQIKRDLLAAGAIYAAMSGSGSTIFGLFREPKKTEGEQLKSYSPYIFEL
ncbi:MAG: 4-(cytidine 5'-diphospho)-2-C-methyl-D-erythritol kinase [Rikenellaceae bacterium]